jgi:hypothetical protein
VRVPYGGEGSRKSGIPIDARHGLQTTRIKERERINRATRTPDSTTLELGSPATRRKSLAGGCVFWWGISGTGRKGFVLSGSLADFIFYRYIA